MLQCYVQWKKKTEKKYCVRSYWDDRLAITILLSSYTYMCFAARFCCLRILLVNGTFRQNKTQVHVNVRREHNTEWYFLHVSSMYIYIYIFFFLTFVLHFLSVYFKQSLNDLKINNYEVTGVNGIAQNVIQFTEIVFFSILMIGLVPSKI